MNPTTYKRRREHVCEECEEFRVWPDRLIYGKNFVVRITITLRTGKVKTEMLTEPLTLLLNFLNDFWGLLFKTYLGGLQSQ